MEQYTPAFPIEVVCSPKAIRCPLLGCPPGGRIGPRSLHRPKRLTGASASYTTQPLKAVAHFRGKPTEHLKEEFMRFSRENLLRPDEVAVVLGSTPKTL